MGMDSETDKISGPLVDGDANSSEFTQANLIGLFLTISLCLLTQPWGSLLYRPLDKDYPAIARILFFIWRVYPIACVAETVIILVCYIDTALEIRRRCLDAQRRVTVSEILNSLHISAVALLLIRANDDRGGPVEEVLEENLSRIQSIPGVIEESESGGGFDTTTIAAQSSAAVSAESTQTTGLLRRRTTNLEAAIPLIGGNSRLQGTTDAPSHTSALKAALNTPVLRRKEKWLDVMEAFSALTVTLKLFMISFPWPFRTAASFMVSGWLAVQSLLCLFHHVDDQDDDDDDDTSVIRAVITRAKRHRAVISHPLSILAIHLVTLPLLLYISYGIGFSFGYPPQESDLWVSRVDRPKPHQFAGMKLDGSIAEDMSMAKYVIYLPLTLPILCLAVPLFYAPLLTLPVMSMVALLKVDFYKAGMIAMLCTFAGEMILLASILDTGQLSIIILYAMSGALSISAGVVLYLAAALPFRFLRSKGIDDTGRATGICCSIIAWLYIFVFAIEQYDGTGSYKPERLEYLG